MAASTFRELYDDFIDQVKRYTEKLDVTEAVFFRRLTKGMQEFQRDTEYLVLPTTLTVGADARYPNGFGLPVDAIHVVEVRDKDDLPLFKMGYTQFMRKIDRFSDGGRYDEMVTDRQYRIRQSYEKGQKARTWTKLDRQILINPQTAADNIIKIVYVPDLHAYSELSPQWTAWNTDEQTFITNFNTNGFIEEITPYENAILAYAIADYIKSLGNINYQVYEQKYREGVARALDAKHTYFTGGYVDYQFGVNA